jgi:hypothetical protein
VEEATEMSSPTTTAETKKADFLPWMWSGDQIQQVPQDRD